MKKMFLILGLLLAFTGQSFAASGSGNISSVIAQCGIPLKDTGTQTNSALMYPAQATTSDIVVLQGGVTSSSAGNMYGLYSASSPAPGAQTQYKVPAGKTLQMVALNVYVNSGTDSLVLAYGAGPLAAEATGTEPLLATYFGPASTTYPLINSAVGWQNYSMPYAFPQNSYPYFKAGQTSQNYSVTLCGLLK